MPEPIQFVDLKRQYASIKDEVDQAVIDAIASTQYILGEEVARFEEEWAAYCSVAHAVGVSSGTAALALAFEVLGVGAGDEVIAPANTFIASVLPVVRLGAIPVLVDCDRYGQLDVERAAAAVTPRTKAIVGVDLFGHPCDADAIRAICDANGLAFVEDAAQAHGAEYRGRRCGSLADIAAFSFYPGKEPRRVRRRRGSRHRRRRAGEPHPRAARPRPEPQVRARSRSAATSASTRSRPPCCA